MLSEVLSDTQYTWIFRFCILHLPSDNNSNWYNVKVFKRQLRAVLVGIASDDYAEYLKT